MKNIYKFITVNFPISIASNLQLDFKDYLNKFITGLDHKGKILIITQLKSREYTMITLGNRTAIDLNNQQDINNYIGLLESKYSYLENWYKSLEIIEIIFNYTIISDQDYNRITNNVLNTSINQINLKEDQFKDVEKIHNLPLDFKYKTWGDSVQHINANTYRVLNIFSKQNLEVISKNRFTKLINIYNNNFSKILFTFQDKIIKESVNLFTRFISGKTYHIIMDKLIFYFNTDFKFKNISKLSKVKLPTLNIIALDTETYTDDKDIMNLYCISTYNGKISKSYYITDYNNVKAMVINLLNDLFTKYNSGKTIYIHNSNNFDLIFLLKYICEYENIKLNPLVRDGKFINLEIKYGKNFEYNIQLRDSYLLLPVALKDLAKSFNTILQKLEFNHNKITKNTILKYKDEVIKYCINDSKLLYEIIKIFNEQIHSNFQVGLSSSPTLPSLSFRIFRTHYMNTHIPIINGHVYNDLYKAYYGGHVDMYIPRAANTTIYHYDINGLYPFVMQEYKFPTKLIGYFIGDISIMTNYKHLYENNLGIYKVEVTAPNIENPLLPHKMNNTTVYGHGKWTGWYFSEEIKNAEQFGYKFNILAGYVFESEYLFKDFIHTMYQNKANSPKDSPNYLIYKLLMNSLAGRFGMNPTNLNHKILDESALSELASNIGVENINTIFNLSSKSLVSFHDLFSKAARSNVAIALAITAYGRIFMSQFLNNPDLTGNLYYMDTDSAFMDKELPSHMISSTILGKMKLENKFKSFHSIGPKAYGGETVTGEIITKVKGYKDILSLFDLKMASYEQGVSMFHTKWFTEVSQANINIREEKYVLKPTNMKRELIFREQDGLLLGTSNKLITE